MTNDPLHASIAAALVQANLTFSTSVGTAGNRPLRTFDVEFELKQSKGTCFVTAYTVGQVFAAFAPLRVRSAKRQGIADALVLALPLVRMLLDPRSSTGEDLTTVWIEVSVPIPPTDVQSTSLVGAVPPWVSLAPFMSVPAGVDFILSTFSADASVPSEHVQAPIFDSTPGSFGSEPRG